MMYLQQIESYRPANKQEQNDKKIIYHYCKENQHNVLMRTNEVAHLTSSGFIMNQSLDKVLVIHHKIYDAWGWTGGHVDGCKDLLEVAVKEAKEETGLVDVKPLSKNMMSIDILPVWGHEKKGQYISSHLHYNASYVLIAKEEDALVENVIETNGVKWICVDEIQEHCNEPELVLIYKKLISAARAYRPSSEVEVSGLKEYQAPMTIGAVIKETAIPIALHETQSAYYKAKLAKEVVEHSGKILGRTLKNNFKKSNDK